MRLIKIEDYMDNGMALKNCDVQYIAATKFYPQYMWTFQFGDDGASGKAVRVPMPADGEALYGVK